MNRFLKEYNCSYWYCFYLLFFFFLSNLIPKTTDLRILNFVDVTYLNIHIQFIFKFFNGIFEVIDKISHLINW